jgi:hypothetical protein
MRKALALLALAVIVTVGAAQAADIAPLFPGAAGGVTVTKPVREFDPKSVYDYMDGGADIYLRFDFQRLDTAEYELAGKPVVVEVYDMGSSPEAYGIFSTNPRGESVAAGQGARFEGPMLRAWQDRYFIKIATSEDTPAFREFATQAARGFATGIGAEGALPDLLGALPAALHPAQIRYLHTDEDMNTAYYVSTDDALRLAKGKTDVAYAEARLGGKPLSIAVIRYRSAAERTKAVAGFTKSIFSKKMVSQKDGTRLEGLRKNEFTGLRPFAGPAGEPRLALCFDAKTAALCTQALDLLTKGPTAK